MYDVELVCLVGCLDMYYIHCELMNLLVAKSSLQ